MRNIIIPCCGLNYCAEIHTAIAQIRARYLTRYNNNNNNLTSSASEKQRKRNIFFAPYRIADYLLRINTSTSHPVTRPACVTFRTKLSQSYGSLSCYFYTTFDPWSRHHVPPCARALQAKTSRLTIARFLEFSGRDDGDANDEYAAFSDNQFPPTVRAVIISSG